MFSFFMLALGHLVWVFLPLFPSLHLCLLIDACVCVLICVIKHSSYLWFLWVHTRLWTRDLESFLGTLHDGTRASVLQYYGSMDTKSKLAIVLLGHLLLFDCLITYLFAPLYSFFPCLLVLYICLVLSLFLCYLFCLSVAFVFSLFVACTCLEREHNFQNAS